MKLESDTGRGCESRQEDGQSAVVLLALFPGIRDEIKIYSLPADCSVLFTAPDRGSFGVNSCALSPMTEEALPSGLDRAA